MVDVAVNTGHAPVAAIVFVTVYVPAVLAARFTTPVADETNTKPAEEVNVPAIPPPENVGDGLEAFWQ